LKHYFLSQSSLVIFPPLTEYGLGGVGSAKAYVYSYGIMLIGAFSGKQPTDMMFETNMSLKQWMYHACSNGGSLINVIDPNLLDEDGDDFSPSMEQCFCWAMELALSCTAKMPCDRSGMIEVAARLKKINKQFLDSVQITIKTKSQSK